MKHLSSLQDVLRLCSGPPDRISAGAGRGPGAGGDGTEVSAEWSLGGGAL